MKVVASVVIRRPPEEVFAFAADFANLPRWDWSVESVHRAPGPIGVGARFPVKLLGGLTLDYEVLAWAPPARLVIRAQTRMFSSEDTIDVSPEGAGARLTYTAELRLPGLRSLFEPAFKPLFMLQGRIILSRLARVLEAA